MPNGSARVLKSEGGGAEGGRERAVRTKESAVPSLLALKMEET
jgi:hypothetical protein